MVPRMAESTSEAVIGSSPRSLKGFIPTYDNYGAEGVPPNLVPLAMAGGALSPEQLELDEHTGGLGTFSLELLFRLSIRALDGKILSVPTATSAAMLSANREANLAGLIRYVVRL